MRWLVLCLALSATPPVPGVNPDMPSYDPVTGAPAPYDTGVAGKVAARLAFRRAQKVYRRLPPWMQRTSPQLQLNSNVTGALAQRVSNLGATNQAHPRLNIGVDMTRDLAGARGRPAQKRAQYDLIHEIGHTEGLGEGGTETVARHLGRRLFGLDTTGQGPMSYEPKVQDLAQRHPNTIQFIKKHLVQQRPDPSAGRLIKPADAQRLKRRAQQGP